MADPEHPFVSRGGLKLEHALTTFGLDVRGHTCADLGCSTGGFTDCLLRRGAAKVYAVDTGYGVLAWTLRHDERVVVMERTNALHVELPEPIDLVVIDAGWTRQAKILPAAMRLLAVEGRVVTLIKPHYEADKSLLRGGILPDDVRGDVLRNVRADISAARFQLLGETDSPIAGSKGKSAGNVEVLALLKKTCQPSGS